jgi:acyl-coenzyme A thioesterase PaaI-like protein
MAGRCQGGFTSLVLDQITGFCAQHAKVDLPPPATATMTVNFATPIHTPCVILARAWMIEITGRKLWVKGVVEDEYGNVCATVKSLFISRKVQPTLL